MRFRQTASRFFALTFLVATLFSAFAFLMPQKAYADVTFNDFTFSYIVKPNNTLIIRGYINDNPVAEWTTLDGGVNFGPTSWDGDEINRNGGPLRNPSGDEVDSTSEAPNIFVGQRARDAEIRGNGFPDTGININNPEYVEAYNTCFDRGTPTTSCVTQESETIREREGQNDDGDDEEEEASCETEGGAMGWIMCPVVKLIDGTLNWLDTQIQRLLEIDRRYYDNEGIRGAFNSIRNIAYIILVPIVLVMVIGTALNFDFISAYTVKRALPRLIIATIFIALSYQISVFLIELTNALGRATLGIITAPFSESLGDINGMSLQSLYAGGIVEGFISGLVGIPIIIFLLIWSAGSLLLGVIAGFLALMLRQMFIVVLMLAAPLAILAWIFPGNDKLWKLWWGSFSKLLLMFPLIMAIIAVGRIFAFTIHEAGGAGLEGSVVQPLMTLVAYLLPYAFIPFTFKFAGGLFATVTGMVNDRSKGLSDRYKQLRGKGVKRLGENAQRGKLFGGNAPKDSRRAKWNERAEMLANQGAGGLTLDRKRRRQRIISHINARELAEGKQFAEQDAEGTQIFANDDAMEAGLIGKGNYEKTMEEITKRGYDQADAASLADQVLKARKKLGDRSFTLTALAMNPKTGSGARGVEGIADHYAAIDEAAGSDAGIRGALIAAAKSGFGSSGRHEVAQASFAKSVMASKELGRAGNDSRAREAAVGKLVESAYENGGPAAVIAARGDKEAEIFAKHINGKLKRAEQSLSEAEVEYEANGTEENRLVVENRKEEVIRQKAAIGSIQDSIGQAKQTVGKVIGDEVMGARIQKTVQVPVMDAQGRPKRDAQSGQVITRTETKVINRVQEMQELASDPRWQQYKKEFQQAIDNQSAQMAALGARPGAVAPGAIQPGQFPGPQGP